MGKMKPVVVALILITVLVASQVGMQRMVEAETCNTKCEAVCYKRGNCNACCKQLGYLRGKCDILHGMDCLCCHDDDDDDSPPSSFAVDEAAGMP